MSIFKLRMNPASDGDFLILTWGTESSPRRALIDLGRTGDYRAARDDLVDMSPFDLFVLTHIDADHIEGAVPVFREKPLPFQCQRVWCNARHQLKAAKKRLSKLGLVTLGAKQMEKITQGIIDSNWPWNSEFESGIVSTDSDEAEQPIDVDGGLTLTLLSPTDQMLADLLPVWDRELAEARLRTTDPDLVEEVLGRRLVPMGGIPNIAALAESAVEDDDAPANGASIAFIATYKRRNILLAADAHPGVLVDQLRKLGYSKQKRLRLDCLKVSHHGSKANTTPEFLSLLDCTCFAFSTDGSRHGHPDPEAIARILANDPVRHKTLIFNFRQPRATLWNKKSLMDKWNYACLFPNADGGGVEFDIGAVDSL